MRKIIFVSILSVLFAGGTAKANDLEYVKRSTNLGLQMAYDQLILSHGIITTLCAQKHVATCDFFTKGKYIPTAIDAHWKELKALERLNTKRISGTVTAGKPNRRKVDYAKCRLKAMRNVRGNRGGIITGQWYKDDLNEFTRLCMEAKGYTYAPKEVVKKPEDSE